MASGNQLGSVPFPAELQNQLMQQMASRQQQLGGGANQAELFPLTLEEQLQATPRYRAQRLWQHYMNFVQQADEKAGAKAKRLLKKFLTPDQWEEFKLTDRFTVIIGKRRYVLGKDLQVKVYNVDDYVFAPPREQWCVRLPGTPIADTLIAQLLMLRSDPARLRNTACVTTRHRNGYRDGGEAQALRMIRRAGYRV